MDRAKDGGIGWRNDIIPFLNSLGIIALNPCDKPIDIGLENVEDRQYRARLKKEKNWKQLSKDVRLLRIVDLNMTDKSDILIVNIDTEIHACGTYEELFWANRLKKPILIHCEQGMENLPDWLYGVLPYQMMFSEWSDLKNYLLDVHSGKNTEHLKRWLFFNYNRMNQI
jgi:hypothetical protein